MSEYKTGTDKNSRCLLANEPSLGAPSERPYTLLRFVCAPEESNCQAPAHELRVPWSQMGKTQTPLDLFLAR